MLSQQIKLGLCLMCMAVPSPSLCALLFLLLPRPLRLCCLTCTWLYVSGCADEHL